MLGLFTGMSILSIVEIVVKAVKVTGVIIKGKRRGGKKKKVCRKPTR